MRLRFTRFVVPVMVAIVLLLTAAPASATVANPTDITCGTYTPLILTHVFGTTCASTNPCVGLPNNVTIAVTNTGGGTTGPWTTLVTSFNNSTGFMGGAVPHVAKMTLVTTGGANNTGTISATRGLTQNLKIRLDLFTTTFPSCVPGTLQCTINATFTGLTGMSTALPTLTTATAPEQLATGTVLTLSGSGTGTKVTLPPCAMPFNTIPNGLNTLTLTLTV